MWDIIFHILMTIDSFLKQALGGQQYRKVPLVEEGSERRYTRILLVNASGGIDQLKNRGSKILASTQNTKTASWILACSPLDQQKYFLWRQKDFLKAGLNVPKLHPRGKPSPIHQLDVSAKKVKKSSPTDMDAQKAFLLMEDLGDQSLEKQVLESSHFPYGSYFQALDQLIKLETTDMLFQSGPTPPPRTKHTFLQEMLWTKKYLIQKLVHYKLEGKERELVLKEWQIICEKIAHYPFLPGHRDFHSRNLFIKNHKIYMIDFQDAGFFPRFYDVVSLIYDVYVDSLMDSLVRENLLDYFISKSGLLDQTNITKQKDFEEEIALTALQRLFQAVGRFASFYCIKRQQTHLRYIYPGLKMQAQLLQFKLLKEGRVAYPYFLNLINQLLKSPKCTKDRYRTGQRGS